MKGSVITAVLLLGLLSRGHGQVVVVGPDGRGGPPPATREYCLSMETIAPNLKLAQDTVVRGEISDQSTAPLAHSPVELRRFISESKQVTVKKVFTNDVGNFDLGVVKQGPYRLLLAPHRGFKQPVHLECEEAKSCTLDTVLIVSPSDQFVTQCPIR
jgi:hypothetical protein